MLTAKDVMNRNVVTIDHNSTVGEVAHLMIVHNISAVPVVDAEKLVGIISDGDLLHRDEIGTTERPRSWWLRLVTDNATLAKEYIKSHSIHIDDVMTKSVVTVTEETSLNEIVNLLERHDIKRVPVVRRGNIVGIVSRSDLVTVLAAAIKPYPSFAIVTDADIREKVANILQREPWASDCEVMVAGGVVRFRGTYQTEADRMAARTLAENVPGVLKIDDQRFPVEIAGGLI